MNIFWGRSQQNLGDGRQGEEAEDPWQEYRSRSTPVGASRSPSSDGSDRYTGPSDGGSGASSPYMDGLEGVQFVSPSPGKKTSRTEAERRHALESDEWTVSVFPHEVVCRGCRHTIKLDRRSRYYPGLWEKHRDRCEGVGKMKEAMGLQEPVEQVWIPPVTLPSAGPSSSRASSSRSSDPTDLAPRKSYYRNM
ncbi:hypothetical protein DFH06DRAFT_1190485 [Mycena polygramma]|nr:hypothetical protein DFH06DRAFT_1190485 [Mycena polygramma]